jgi:hypothetical protein
MLVLLMDFDNFGIPPRLFVVTNPELPVLIGCVVMLAAFIESKVWAITVSVANDPQDQYAGLSGAENIKTIKKRLRLFTAGRREQEFVEKVTAFIDDVDALLKERNALVHRVWSHGDATESAGWRQVPPSQRKNGQDWIEVEAYTPQKLKQLIAEFVLVAERAWDIVSLASAMDRRP